MKTMKKKICRGSPSSLRVDLFPPFFCILFYFSLTTITQSRKFNHFSLKLFFFSIQCSYIAFSSLYNLYFRFNVIILKTSFLRLSWTNMSMKLCSKGKQQRLVKSSIELASNLSVIYDAIVLCRFSVEISTAHKKTSLN